MSNVNDLSKSDREILLHAFRQFRASYDEDNGSDYRHRDGLEDKLQGSGMLDDDDKYILRAAIENEVQNQEMIEHLYEVLS